MDSAVTSTLKYMLLLSVGAQPNTSVQDCPMSSASALGFMRCTLLHRIEASQVS